MKLYCLHKKLRFAYHKVFLFVAHFAGLIPIGNLYHHWSHTGASWGMAVSLLFIVFIGCQNRYWRGVVVVRLRFHYSFNVALNYLVNFCVVTISTCTCLWIKTPNNQKIFRKTIKFDTFKACLVCCFEMIGVYIFLQWRGLYKHYPWCLTSLPGTWFFT